MTPRLNKDRTCTISWCPCHRSPISISASAPALEVRCPVCKAHKRHYCRTSSGARRNDVHRRRIHRRFTVAGMREAGLKYREPEIQPTTTTPPTIDECAAPPPATSVARLQDTSIFASLTKEPST